MPFRTDHQERKTMLRLLAVALVVGAAVAAFAIGPEDYRPQMPHGLSAADQAAWLHSNALGGKACVFVLTTLLTITIGAGVLHFLFGYDLLGGA